jgi:CRISPR-associated exonuclease Cas4
MRGLLLALLLALLGAALLYWSRRERLAAGLPPGEVVYADTGAWQRCEKPLFSPHYRLTGKPDYLVREGRQLIPVEVKPGRDADQPYEGDVLQLAAYCLLVEDEYGQHPQHGYLKYAHRVFRVAFTENLHNRLLGQLEDMRRDLDARDVAPNHAEPQRCLGCGHHQVCDRRLA